MIKSKALEINLAGTQVDVAIDPKYSIFQEVMSDYYGLAEGLNNFLKELSHPLRNWKFIVQEARGYSLDYFHLLVGNRKGKQAAALYIEIFTDAIVSSTDREVKAEAADNLLLFLQKIIRDSGSDLEEFLPILDAAFRRIHDYDGETFQLFVWSYYQIRKLAQGLAGRGIRLDGRAEAVNRLLLKYYRYTFSYWLGEVDPLAWYESEAEEAGGISEPEAIFSEISHRRIRELAKRMETIAGKSEIDGEELLTGLLDLPGHTQFVDAYREIPQKLLSAVSDDIHGRQWKLLFIFHIMNTAGLSMIHEEALRELNRTLSWLIAHDSPWNVQRLIQKTFSILKERTGRFPATALNCVLNMGKEVYRTEDADLITLFIDLVVDLGFHSPMIKGVGNDWQFIANNAHILNIRTWLELIALNPKWSSKLLSALIIHLSVCGVFIKDTDLFPRDITRFLNSDIGKVYNLAKQLARIFPAYFNDIGAEGKLREISTRIDEITRRGDPLIHFLRKQSHVESSNQILGFMAAVIDFWGTRKKKVLKPFLPPDIFERIAQKGRYVDGMHRAVLHLKKSGIALPEGLLALPDGEVGRVLARGDDIPAPDLERMQLFVELYRMLHQKYSLDFVDLVHYIPQLRTEALPDLNELKEALAEPDGKKKLVQLLSYLEKLKALILDARSFEVREDIYKKRHITVDIPSMYGSYHEMKFDALGLTFRIESLVNVLLEEQIRNIDLSLITKATFYQIHERLKYFDRALKLDGINSIEMEHQLDFLHRSLEIKGITLTQYIDIVKGFAQAVHNIVHDHFNNIHEGNLNRILSKTPLDRILPRYLPQDEIVDPEKIEHRISEIFFRERIAISIGLQQLDRFLGQILHTLYEQSGKLPKDKLRLLLNYDSYRAMTCINEPSERVSGIIYLGTKGFNMVKLKSFGLPVPPGFIITTEVFRCREVIDCYPPAEQNLKDQVARHIRRLEAFTGKTYGDPENPLLLSVRSGSSISQPGMMDTFLDVGNNDRIAEGFAARTGNTWFAWDNFRRFLQGYGMASGLERDHFDAIMRGHKLNSAVSHKRGFTGDQMRELALSYKRFIQNAGIEIPEDPVEQLYQVIKKVFASWESPKAKTYRKIMGISDDWGTAVTVQAMVYGNLSPTSGTGVFFTHNPRWSGDILRLWGDFTLGNQGEDVVSGLVQTLPISIIQQDTEMRETDMTLETDFPEIYAALRSWAYQLVYERGWSPQEIEFTFESRLVEDLYLLQTRDMAMRERKRVLAFDPDSVRSEKYLGHGIGVSGGAMTGRAVFSLEDIDHWRREEPDTSLILIRGDTVPDDIREIFAADGLLTARGGLTSHAAVVAHRLGKTCIVGCGNLVCNEPEKQCLFDGSCIGSGDPISIDGQEGSVYSGFMPLKEA